MASDKDQSLDQKDSEEEQVYKTLNDLGTGATHRGNSGGSSLSMSMGASMEFMDSFACVDDDDDLADLTADAEQFQKLDSDKPKSKQQPPRTASRQPALDLIGEGEEEEDEEEENS